MPINLDYKRPPVIKALTINAITRVKSTETFTINFIADDVMVDLQGGRQHMTAMEVIALLKDWSNSDLTPSPLVLNSILGLFDNKYVMIDAPVYYPIEVVVDGDQRKTKLLCSLTLTEA